MVHIITDTASDYTLQEARELGIELLPLTVMFGDVSYRDRYDLTYEEFYRKLIETDELPTTSQINPTTYEDAFSRIAAAGDTAVCITISSKLSGCYQSACIAAGEYEGQIFVVDSLNASIGERILVDLALRYRRQGADAAEIANRLKQDRKDVRMIGVLDTLEYLKKGGRISKTIALAGSVLNIKPVVAMEDGEIKLLGKARGSKNGSNMLKSLVLQEPINFAKPLRLAYAGLSSAMLDKYVEDSRDLYPCKPEELPYSGIGSTIGTHIGPGAIALAYFTN